MSFSRHLVLPANPHSNRPHLDHPLGTAHQVEAVVRISTSAIVIGPDSGVLYGECHARIEKHVEERGSRVVDLQPNFFFTNLLVGLVKLGLSLSMCWLPAADL